MIILIALCVLVAAEEEKKVMNRLLVKAAIVTLFLVTSALVSAFADVMPITDSGLLNITNSPVSTLGITGLTTPLCLNFGGGTTCAGMTHPMDVAGAGNSNLFVSPGTGSIKDLNTTGALTDFETVTGAGALTGQTIHFDLTSVVVNGSTASGNCNSNAPLNSCQPANSPFALMENAAGTVLFIGFNVLLDGYTGSSSTGSTPYEGVFTTQQAGLFSGTGACSGKAADITNFISCEAAGGTLDVNWSATEAPVPIQPTPEPISLVFLGSVLLALTPRLRRSRNRWTGAAELSGQR
jgi:hypothetical protein